VGYYAVEKRIKTSLLVPFPKKGDPRDSDRTVALIPHYSRAMLKVFKYKYSIF
jgi:hypothetical protein